MRRTRRAPRSNGCVTASPGRSGAFRSRSTTRPPSPSAARCTCSAAATASASTPRSPPSIPAPAPPAAPVRCRPRRRMPRPPRSGTWPTSSAATPAPGGSTRSSRGARAPRAASSRACPHGLRYAAVAAAGPRVVIAGGTLPDGSASRDVFVFDSRTRTVSRIRSLPRSTTHAAAAALGPLVLVLGGRARDDDVGVARDRRGRPGAWLDPPAGSLQTARSDLAAVTVRRACCGGRSRALRHAGGHDVGGAGRARTPRTPSPPSPPATSTPPLRRAG